MTAKEKMTAPIASVGADVEQPSSNKLTNQSIADLPGKSNLQATNNAENTAKSANKKNPDDLETVSMMELYDTVYPPKLPIVDGLLYNGTYLFVGSPKIGKSFFMAQIGYHISKGLPLWGFSVRQGTVLYLALEDDYARLQKRLSQMFGMEGSENFYFATKSKSLNDGLERQLVTFVTEHKDARLIIIDNWHGDFVFQSEEDAKEKEIPELEKYFLSEKVVKYVMATGTKNFYSKPKTDLDIARPLLTTMHKMHRAGVDNYVTTDGRLRKLTPRECLRLMGFSDNFKIVVSDTSMYQQAGNSIVVDVLIHIMNKVIESCPSLVEEE